MSDSERDIRVIEHIHKYCVEIEETVARFGNSFEIFESDFIYRNAIAMCILQIGELVGVLTDDFKKENSNIPWKQIKLMRNIVAHRYGTVDNSITWEVLQKDIPELKTFTEKSLSAKP